MFGNRCICHESSETTSKSDASCKSRCGTLKNLHCSMNTSAKLTVIYQQLGRLLLTEKFIDEKRKKKHLRKPNKEHCLRLKETKKITCVHIYKQVKYI